MPTHSRQTRIAAPPDAVFAALTDPRNVTAIFGANVRAADLPAGPLRPGMRVRQTRTVGGMEVSGDLTVEVVRPPKELALSVEAKGVRIDARWVLKPEDDGRATRVDYECSVKGSGLASFFAGAVSEAVRRADAEHLERLRPLVERS